VILTQAFLESQDACEDGKQACIDRNYLGLEYGQVIRRFLIDGDRDYAGWLLQVRATEAYVRANGGVIKMGAYQVFNPLTGVHTRYETEAEARAALVQFTKLFLENCGPKVLQELSNENGDKVWTGIDMHTSLVVS
jgi:hypothetical protein